MRNIVLLINSLDGGGAERVVATLLNELCDSYKCTLILLENKLSYELNPNINVICMNEKANISNTLKLIRMPILSYKLYRIIRKHQFNQVISFLLRSNCINILSKILSSHKAIISERIAPSSMYSEKSISSLLSKTLIKMLYPHASKVISVSQAISHDLCNNFSVCQNVDILYNPYKIDRIINLSKLEINLDFQKSKVIVAVGSLSKRKDYTSLITAFSLLKEHNYKLCIIGSGTEELALKELAQRLEIYSLIYFVDFDNNPYKYMAKADLFVLSSLSEGFPNVLVEAMICGLPVISTDCLSGPREILSPSSNCLKQTQAIEYAEFGILTPASNPVKLSQAIHNVLTNDNLKQSYITKSKERSQSFSIEKIVPQFVKMVRD